MKSSRFWHTAFTLLVALSLLTLSSCLTWYERNQQFNQYIAQGQLQEAEALISGKKKPDEGKNKLLFHMNRGWLRFMMEDDLGSVQDFQTADHLIEDASTQYGFEALALISNPNVKPYKAEDFEKAMVNYYKALAFLRQGDMEAALVECRRINLKLQALNDKYPDHKNKYQQDAFANLLMGLIYDASGNTNDAFIAYRNAFNIYSEDYAKLFGLKAPEQLKDDLMRTAYLNGFREELARYEEAFGRKYVHNPQRGGQAVVLWHTGLGPVKAEWSLNFVQTGSGDGWFTFANTDYGIEFPVYFGQQSSEERDALKNLSVLRVAFPKYLERRPTFTSATVRVQGKTYPLELAQDINAIAFRSLNDRMMREIGASIARLAVKKAMEASAKKKDEYDFSAAVSLINAATEKADTRNWQTLPNQIHYARLSLPAGKQEITLEISGSAGQVVRTIEADIPASGTRFLSLRQLDAYPPADRFGI